MKSSKMDPEPRQEPTQESSSKLSFDALDVLKRHWGWLVLLLWGGGILSLGLLRFDPYGIEESAARGLLLVWSIGDRVLNPLVTLGIPDFRVLLFLPLGFYWPGSIIAAKVYTLLLAFGAVALLYKWCVRESSTEVAQIACALLLISPLLLNQIDAVGAGIYLLLMFTVAEWLDRRYRKIRRPLGGWFFMQLLWTGHAITIHPMGLAYPLALGWHWNRSPLDERQQRHVFIGLALVIGVVLGVRGGWEHVSWLADPILPLAQSFQAIIGVTGEPSLFLGWLLALLGIALILIDRRFLLENFLGSILLGALLIGAFAADVPWALMLYTFVLVRGVHYLIRINQSLGGYGLIRQRGLVIVAFFTLATTSMLADKARHLAIEENQLGPQDHLLRWLVQDAEDNDLRLSVASQWPGRTLLATRQDTFPLPPAQGLDGEAFLKSIEGITHLVFDPFTPGNKPLADLLSTIPDRAKTAQLNPAGVVVVIVPPPPAATEATGTAQDDAVVDDEPVRSIPAANGAENDGSDLRNPS